MNRLRTLLTSKTVWGTVAAVIGWLSQQPKLDAKTLLTGAGVVLAGVGARDSVTKLTEKIDQP